MARSNLSRKIVALAVIGAGIVGTYELGAALTGGDAADARRFANQVWIERLPKDDRDMIHHLVAIEDGNDRFGAFGKSSQWRHLVDIFLWAREDNRVSIVLPQERRRIDLGVRVWDCADEAPSPFQLCLELTNKAGKSASYYSRYDWRIDATPESLAELTAAAPELAPVLADLARPAAAVDAAGFTEIDELE